MWKAKMVGEYGHIMYVAGDTKKQVENFIAESRGTTDEIKKTSMMKVCKDTNGEMCWLF